MGSGYFIVIILVLSVISLGASLSLIWVWRKNRAITAQVAAVKDDCQKMKRKFEQQAEIIFQVTHRLIEAPQEHEIIQLLLDVSHKIADATGVSFVPLDDHGNAMAAIQKGHFPFPIPEAWLEYLASPVVRRECSKCSRYEAHDPSCPLLKPPFSESFGLYCFPLRYGWQELGMMNVYLPAMASLEVQTRAFLNSIVEIAALALAGERLRQRERLALDRLKSVRQRQDLSSFVKEVMEIGRVSLGASGSILVLNASLFGAHAPPIRDKIILKVGKFPPGMEEVEKNLLAELSTESAVIRCLEKAKNGIDLAWMSVPVKLADGATMGVWVVVGDHTEYFTEYRIAQIQQIANHLVDILQNMNMLAGLEYQIVMDERTRLSREIHDGLAQTLGFLKLQVAQLFNYLEHNDMARLRQATKLIYDTLASAYNDARQAIDGLRVTPTGKGGDELRQWLQQTLAEYEAQPFSVEVEVDETPFSLPDEVHAQLIRIVQEALSNIRKHAKASKAWISVIQKQNDFILEIRDNGIGFTPEDVPSPSRFGLRGMRERAELLGADFQVISQPGAGTTIRLRLPLDEKNVLEV